MTVLATDVYSLEYIARCEAGHFVSSGFAALLAGWLAYSWTRTIFYSNTRGPLISALSWLFPLSLSLAAAACTHYLEDATLNWF